MEAPISPGRRTLLKAGALTLATPVIGAVAQPAASHQEATTFDLWVISGAVNPLSKKLLRASWRMSWNLAVRFRLDFGLARLGACWMPSIRPCLRSSARGATLICSTQV